LIDVVKIIISKHTPEKQQRRSKSKKQRRSNKEAAKKKQRSNKEAAKKQQRRSKEEANQRSKEEAKHNDILRFVPFHHPTHHLHWAYDGLDIVVLL
jgi:negative regulator of genetic competence, sporulation and motility